MDTTSFTDEERKYLLSLDAVDKVWDHSISYSKDFRNECIRRYNAGESPAEIFASAGLPSSLIGYKRIERAVYRWKKSETKSTEEQTIQAQKARIAQLESQVKALKALGALARATRRAPAQTKRNERIGVVALLKSKDPSFDISAACDILEI